MKFLNALFIYLCFGCYSKVLVHENSSSTELAKINNCSFYFDSILDKKVYTTYDTAAVFKGGNLKMLKYIKERFQIEDSDNFSFDFQLELIINDNGEILDVDFANDYKEAITNSEIQMKSIFEGMPKWKPAVCGSDRVTSKSHIKIRI